MCNSCENGADILRKIFVMQHKERKTDRNIERVKERKKLAAGGDSDKLGN